MREVDFTCYMPGCDRWNPIFPFDIQDGNKIYVCAKCIKEVGDMSFDEREEFYHNGPNEAPPSS